MLVLEVGLSVVTDDPVGVGGGRACLGVGRADLSVQVVVKPVEQTLAQVHVADRVDALSELHTAGHLAVAVGPVVLNAFHVPLVHNHHHFLALGLVNLSKQVLVALVDHDLFDFGEEGVCRLDEPVHVCSVQTLLSEGLRAYQRQLVLVGVSLLCPARLKELEAAHHVVSHIEASLVQQALPSHLVHLCAQELNFSANLLSSIASVFDLEARTHGREVFSKSKVPPEKRGIGTQAEELTPSAIAVIVVNGLIVGVPVELRCVLVKLLLAVNILEEARIGPPLGGSLNEHLVWLDLFDEFLSALSQHRGLVSSAHQVHILSIEAFGQVHESGLEAVVPIQQVTRTVSMVASGFVAAGQKQLTCRRCGHR